MEIRFVVVERVTESGGTYDTADFDNYEAALSLIEDMRGGIYSIEKRWYV